MSKYYDKYKEYEKYISFIEEYRTAENASSGSKFDANANVSHKNVTTMQGEIPKETFIGTNRLMMWKMLNRMYGESMADKYIHQLEEHDIYKHDETSLKPYTYGAHEVVNVLYKGSKYTVPMHRLYDLAEEPEVLLDAEKEVYGKYPEDLLVEDVDGFTGVTRLVKKKRHRDLVRVKTAFNNDIIVTDNHPMIVGQNCDTTVPAAESKGFEQLRLPPQMEFSGSSIISMEGVLSGTEFNKIVLSKHILVQEHEGCSWYMVPRYLALNKELGYLIGFFIGDGDYGADEIHITQKKNSCIERLADIVCSSLGSAPRIYKKHGSDDIQLLAIGNPAIVHLFRNVFHIGSHAENKSLPENIFEYTEEFASGIIEGLIDSDGTVANGQYTIRISSRTCINQLAAVLDALGVATSMTTQQTKYGQNDVVDQKYQIFGITFRDREDIPLFAGCSKWQGTLTVGHRKSIREGHVSITNVYPIDNEPYLAKNEYIYDITTESHTFRCNGLWVHNCVSITMYPFLFDGLKNLGGSSRAPKHLESFCGIFTNMVFAVASQFAGAVSTPEMLTYMDYFIRKDYGDEYYKNPDRIVTMELNPRTLGQLINDKFAQIVYTLNQPAAARDYQSIFHNIAYFDKNYFEGIFGEFVFPDGTVPKWESVSWLQKRFMKWFNAERLKEELTFPVETVNLLDDGENYVDEEWADFAAEMYAEGHSFFTYRSNSVDSLASCCRLRNELQDNTFSFTLGAGGVSTGSKGVITMNVNRLVQKATREGRDISEAVREQVEDIHCYLKAFNEIIKEHFESRLLPVYDAGYISLEKQFLTIGINGFVEGAEFLGIEISPNEEYYTYGEKILKPIYELNKAARTEEIMFNTEFVPAENLGVKNAKWDKKDGYVVPRECYNSYFYLVEDEGTNMVDKFILHGGRLTKYLDGGSALHMNLQEHLSKEQYKMVMKNAIKTGCSYYTFNIPNTICNDCGHISKHMLEECPVCKSKFIDYLTRIIGYLKRVSAFSAARQKEAGKRYYE